MTGQRTGQPCISCDSSDAMTIYPKGDAYCFSCETYFSPRKVEQGETDDMPDKTPEPRQRAPSVMEVLQPAAVPERGLDRQTLEYYGVGVTHSLTNGEVDGLVFPVYRDGERVGEKSKNLTEKQYTASGSTKNPDLFGSWRCREGGKLLIITEGEEDCMSAHQLLRNAGKEYNVVSLPNGANTSAIRKNLEWVETFESVVLNLDNDEIGQKAAKEIADVITPGKVRIMSLPVKDANDFLLARHSGMDYLKYLNRAKSYQPDGIVNLADCWDVMWEDTNQPSVPFPWQGLNDKLYGLRERELLTLTAGTGIGKSAVVRELEHHLLKTTEDRIGVLALEESVGRTGWGIVSVEANLNLAVKEERARALAEGRITQEDIYNAFQATLGTGRVHTLDHWGSTQEKKLFSRLRYLIRGLECKWIILDHLNLVVSGMDEIGDERRAIDSIMTKLRQMCEETGVGMILVCHLKRASNDKGHEQGVEVTLAHLRGSQAIAQLSDGVVALERNQQADNPKEANLTHLRVLKNRYAGLTGPASYLSWDRDTGRLVEVTNVDEYLAPPISEAGV